MIRSYSLRLLTTFALVAAAPAALSAQTTASVIGAVKNAATNAPLSGIDVRVYTAAGTSVGSASTDATGAYAVTGLEPGTYYVRTGGGSFTGLINQCYNARPCADYPGFYSLAGFPAGKADALILTAGQTFTANFALPPGGAVSGQITTAVSGKAVDGAFLVYYDGSGTPMGDSPPSFDAGGNYLLSGLPSGRYFLSATGRGVSRQIYNDRTCGSSCGSTWLVGDPVTVTTGQTTSGINFVMTPACDLSVSPNSLTFPGAGGVAKVSVISLGLDCSWTAVSNDPFITVTAGTSGNGAGNVTFSVSALSSGVRRGTLTIAGKTVYVSQDLTTCTYAVSRTAASFAGTGGAGTVTVVPSASDCAWTATSNSSFASITSIGSGALGSGIATVAYAVAPFSTGIRTATLTIAGKTLIVTQAASGCTYQVTPAAASFSGPGGNGTVTVTPSAPTCTWTAASNDSFLTVTPAASGTGIGTVAYSVAALTSGVRTGTLMIAGKTITVSQTVNGCTYIVSPLSVVMDTTAGTGTVQVTTGSACTWTATPNDPFLALAAGGSGTGSAVIAFSVPSNLSPGLLVRRRARQGTISVAGQSVRVAQKGDASTCGERLSSADATFTSAAGVGTFVVSTSSGYPCEPVILIDVPWVTTDSIGGARVTYQVAENTTGATRVGTMLIGAFVHTITQTALPGIGLDKGSLTFAVARSGVATSGPFVGPVTPSQVVHVTQQGPGQITWTVSSDQSWLFASGSGTGSGAFQVQAAVDGGLPAGDRATGSITVTLSGASTPTVTLPVTLTIIPPSTSKAPFGLLETPVGDSTPLHGSVAVTGWALDDVGIRRVEIWRDLQPGETTPPFSSNAEDPRRGKVFVANAVFVEGARPDVERLNPTMPFNYRAGWGYLLLTWGLWNQGNGTYNLYAYAFDQENNVASIGKKTIVVSNNTATKPFGSIDTPEIGGTASGPNFGWGLTPKVNGAATCKIQPSGVQVSIDSGPLQPVAYGADVRSDVAGTFVGFSNSAAAGGHYLFDWSTLSNGPHTIGWLITDDCNRADGVGSRFFNVTTGTSALTAPEFQTYPSADLRLKAEATGETSAPLLLSRGYGELPAFVEPDLAGSRTIEVTQGERIELRLPPGFDSAYQLGPAAEPRPLPIGSTWDAAAGIFYWQPAPGFLGRYRLVFSNGAERISIRVVVSP